MIDLPPPEGAWLGLSRVGLFEAIRRDRRREGLSIRALANRYQVHRRTVRQALASPVPPPRKRRCKAAPKLDPVKPLIDVMLREDLTAPRKQRRTARRVLARLVDEHGVGDITYSTVRDYVRIRRAEINAEAGRCVEEAFVPQTHNPAAEAEVDFADLWVDLKGIRTKVFLFTLRMSYSGKAVHRAFASQSRRRFSRDMSMLSSSWAAHRSTRSDTTTSNRPSPESCLDEAGSSPNDG